MAKNPLTEFAGHLQNISGKLAAALEQRGKTLPETFAFLAKPENEYLIGRIAGVIATRMDGRGIGAERRDHWKSSPRVFVTSEALGSLRVEVRSSRNFADGADGADVEVADEAGRVVQRKPIAQGVAEFDLPAGRYNVLGPPGRYFPEGAIGVSRWTMVRSYKTTVEEFHL